MKTNQNMPRVIGNFTIPQRTKDGYFNASSLLNQWNTSSGMKKNINHFFDNKETISFIKVLEESLLNDGNTRNSEKPKNQSFTKTKAKTNSKGQKVSGEIWMHPYLFIDFAMWINPKYKLKVIKFAYDEMIDFRKKAGLSYSVMASFICLISNKRSKVQNIKGVAEAVNYIVFGKHKKGIRNMFGEESKQRELYELEEKISHLIKHKFIKTYNDLITHLRVLYKEKQEKTPSVFETKNIA